MREMQQIDDVESSTKTWVLPVIILHKKNGFIGLSIDYCRVNDITKRSSWSFPWIDYTTDILINDSKFRICKAVTAKFKCIVVTVKKLCSLQDKKFGSWRSCHFDFVMHLQSLSALLSMSSMLGWYHLGAHIWRTFDKYLKKY